ncbi:MAG: hypothetical protein KZQ70_09300 [gamma proteobacterium symbiont of Lucinoma myriamae]|nr:hypothetical protein [gamma proteobacterium symbiont of Lucinoma myriamae]
MSDTITPNIFTLKFLCCNIIAKNKLMINILPISLQKNISFLNTILERHPTITIQVSLFNTLNIIHLETYMFPNYITYFNLPFHTSIKNITNGLHVDTPRQFRTLNIQYLAYFNISIADITNFISDITGKSIGIPDIININYIIETDFALPQQLCSIIHFYQGNISTLKQMIQNFKYYNFANSKQMTKNFHSENEHLYFFTFLNKNTLVMTH